MKQKPLLSTMLVGSAMLLAFACRRNEQEDINAPAFYIRESEALTLPADIQLPANAPKGNVRVATYFATGVQTYRAREVPGSPGQYEWVFVAPQAELFSVSNSQVGSHGAGPHWTISAADSIFGQPFSPARTAPSPDPESIDWLLLKAKAGTVLTGVFADVDYIQRIATQGGKPPLTPPGSASQTIDVKYKDVYRFTKSNE